MADELDTSGVEGYPLEVADYERDERWRERVALAEADPRKEYTMAELVAQHEAGEPMPYVDHLTTADRDESVGNPNVVPEGFSVGDRTLDDDGKPVELRVEAEADAVQPSEAQAEAEELSEAERELQEAEARYREAQGRIHGE